MIRQHSPRYRANTSNEAGASPTTREDFGAALAALARLYGAAERQGDLAGAEKYACIVDLLLGAYPSYRKPDDEPVPPAEGRLAAWPAHEETLTGLGTIP
jgi:hypothetical protein